MPLNKNLQPLSGTCRYCGQPASFQIAFSSDSSDRKQLELSSREIWAAVGFNSSLFGGNQAAAVREAWRLALFGVLSPLGRLVQTELRAKLGDVTLDWSELRASDLSGRARAFQSMVGGGMAVAEAVAVAGLMVTDD